MNIPKNALILVVDGRKTLFLRNTGEGENVELATDSYHDRSEGETPGADGHGKHFTHEGDRHQLEEDRNATDAANQLRIRALDGDFEALVIIAPPKTLGELRKHLHKEVESRIVMELAKEMTDRSLPEIATLLMSENAS